MPVRSPGRATNAVPTSPVREPTGASTADPAPARKRPAGDAFGARTPARGGLVLDPQQSIDARTAARPVPAWMGNTTVHIAREPSDHARGAEGFTFGTWARQRAAVTTFNFEVWAPGFTDRQNPDLWRQLDVKVHYRYNGTGDYQTSYVNNTGRSGENAVYSLDLRKTLDPWSDADGISQAVPRAPATEVPGGHMATVDFFFSVNGKELRPASGGNYTGTFENY